MVVVGRHCVPRSCTIGIVCGPPVGFQWSVKISWRMGLPEEQDGAVVGPLPCVSGPLSILNAWCHTPSADVIK